MKKYKLIILLFILILNPVLVLAENIKGQYGNYSDALEIVKETMKSYYIRGPYIQYNYSKTQYPILSPEESTSQDTKYSVCASYTYGVYAEAFGMKYQKDVSEFPRYNYEISNAAENYYDNYISNNKGNDGTFLIYYQNNSESIKYIYGDNDFSEDNDTESLINSVKPGDIFVYTGHALIAYDVVINPETGKKDVLILNSDIDQYIRTRISGTSKLSYNIFKSSYGNNNFLDIDSEGTIQWIWLSKLSNFLKNGILDCQKDECAVIRPFYEENGNAIFNYNIDTEQYSKGKLRTQYPGLLIEKTVNVGDNNSISVGDELIYTIKVTNKSNISSKPIDYQNFIIEEKIGDYVTYLSSNGTYNNGNIKWTNKLGTGESITLTYSVKVNSDVSNISKKIISTGKFYSLENSSNFITTGTVENKIINKQPQVIKTYEECYNKLKTNFSGLQLIDEINSCVYGKNKIISYNDNLKFEDLIIKTAGTNPKSTSKVRFSENEISQTIYTMILNNYWNGLVIDANEYFLPDFNSSFRSDTINPNDFINGDILIYYIKNSKYTNEDGLYAYVYINGKFVGINGSENTIRNEFTHNYYTKEYAKHNSQAECQKIGLSSSIDCDYFYNLYEGYNKLTTKNKEKILEYANYQTLYDKDYYIILRPSLSLISNNVNNEILENPPTNGNFKLNVIVFTIFASTIAYVLIRKKTKFIKQI